MIRSIATAVRKSRKPDLITLVVRDARVRGLTGA